MRKTEYPPALRDLVAQLRQMPGVGPRSAERIALWMVQARGDQPERMNSVQTLRLLHGQRTLRHLLRFFARD
jgi:recombination protein RecR